MHAYVKGLHTENPQLIIDGGTYVCPKIEYVFVLPYMFKMMHEKCGFSFADVAVIGHRFVHGGNRSSSVVIDDTVLTELHGLSSLAPLHNDPALKNINVCRAYFPSSVLQVAVFDTAFHATLPPVASMYAIDQTLARTYGIKRYGFHGISHAFLWNTYHAKRPNQGKVITMHLGNGCSIAAIDNGRSMDTSMGFTPLEGLVMATRSGDIDPAVVEFLCMHEGKSVQQIIELLNNSSGLLGLSEIHSEMQILIDLYEKKEAARIAVDLFCYRVAKYVGAYMIVLEGVDALIFSGGIGENAPFIREQIVRRLEWLGIGLNKKKNRRVAAPEPGAMHKISSVRSLVEVYVIGTDENRYIAQEVVNVYTS